jgi:hypothetical protein
MSEYVISHKMGCNVPELVVEQKGKQQRYCVDCGELSTFKYPSAFKSNRYRCFKCSVKKRSQDPVRNKKISIAQSKRYENLIYLKWITEFNQKKAQDPEFRKKHKESMQKMAQDPEWIRKQRERNKLPVANKKRKETMIKLSQDPEWKQKQKEGIRKKGQDPIWRMKQKEATLLTRESSKWYENYLIGTTGQGYWYGHPSLCPDNRKYQYCMIFKDVTPRVRAFQGNECLLCGKTEVQNLVECGKCLTVHHVFYEKQVCCWKDQNNEYWTNLGIKKHPKKDYYIGENPNYFVVLCNHCHCSNSGGASHGNYEARKASADKLRALIDEQFGGKSYYTENEMIEHGYVKISKYKWDKLKK